MPAPPVLTTRLSAPDLQDPAFPAGWQALADAAGAPAFLSWSWLGCRAATRFTDPLLVQAFDGPTLVGQALFNRQHRALHLHATGNPAEDSVFIEHNGIVATHPAAAAAILAAVAPLAPRILLPGIGDATRATLAELGGIVVGVRTRPAPTLDLTTAGCLSRNTAAQLRRSDRSYSATGPLTVSRAETPDQAEAWLDEMLPLHAATWAARGIASAFLAAPVQRFTRALLRDALHPCSLQPHVDLLRVTAGPRRIGLLLNLRGARRALAYQSGFDYADAHPHEKPGLTCHAAAIAWSRAQGLLEYDFLAGEARYKRSLASHSRDLHWLTWKPRPALFGVEAQIRTMLRRS